MVLPIWIPAAIAGALVNRYNARRALRHKNGTKLHGAAWLGLPILLVTAEAASPPAWETVSVSREVKINAGSNVIWPLLVQVSRISSREGRPNLTQDVLGVPRPTDATIVIRNDKLIRVAHWGTGLCFEEEITHIRPGQSLRWHFRFPNRSIQRYTDQHIAPDGPVLQIADGAYELLPTATGQTRLRLTTTYQMRTRMGGNLRVWGDKLLGDVQDNVLAIIKDRAESPTHARVRPAWRSLPALPLPS